MNNELETIQRLILQLLQNPGDSLLSGDSVSLPSGNDSQASVSSATPPYAPFSTPPLGEPGEEGLNLPISTGANTAPSELSQPDSAITIDSFFDLGDIPAVQDRFQALLKRKLQTEIEHHPPLFPWESEIQEYPVNLSTSSTPETVWMAHLRSLNLPTRLPDAVLAQLFGQAQRVAATSLQAGVKLIKSVEALFPPQPETLNQVATMVLASASPVRGAASPMANLPADYDGANPHQQVALTMLAAQEMLSHLSLEVSPSQPSQQRTWQSDQGPVGLTADYHPEQPTRLNLRIYLPAAGNVQLQGAEMAAAAQRAAAGYLSLGIDEPGVNQIYTLKIQLRGDTVDPLTYALTVTA
ncbi:MAG: hypothetical protein AAF728_03295 [Cyanobacteria bacterium P01_D01_bin.128]